MNIRLLLIGLREAQYELSAIRSQIKTIKTKLERLEIAERSKTYDREMLLEQIGEAAPEIGDMIDTSKMLKDERARERLANDAANKHDPSKTFNDNIDKE